MSKPDLKLSGMDGNIFAILGAASKAASRYNRDVPPEDMIDWDSIQRECMSGDYDHAIQTLMKHFNVN